MQEQIPLGVKWDGAPAIVFGTDPRNNKFFVGTKSVFNKKRVKICYSYEDIDENYKGELANILRLCFRNLPRIGGIVQGDYIGVSGGTRYTPNTLEYIFSTATSGNIVFAPHTCYTEISPDAVPTFGCVLSGETGTHMVGPNEGSAFIQKSKKRFNWAKFIYNLARAQRPSKKHYAEILKHVNKWVREGLVPPAEKMYKTLPAKYKGEVNVYTFKVWDQIFQLKQSLMDNIEVSGSVTPYLNGEPTAHEGFVTQTEHPVKLVDRLTFSKANFKLNG